MMLNKFALSTGIAVLCASVVGAQSTQQPPTTTTPQTQSMQQPAQDKATTTTVEGCVYREQDIPGRTPNVAERAGVLEDYILVASNKASTGTVGTSGTTGTTGTEAAAAADMKPKMFKLEHAEDNKLSALVGKRVQVTGKVDAERSDRAATTGAATGTTTPAQDRSMGPDQIELPEFEVTSIQEIAGECPAKPAERK